MEVGEMVAISTAVYNGRFRRWAEWKEDLVSEGVLGIMRAIEVYDESRGVKLGTFAWKCAERRMLMFLRKERKHREVLASASVDDLEECIGVADDYSNIFPFTPQREAVSSVKVVINGVEVDVLRELLDGGKQKDVARRCGVTRQYVSYIFKRVCDDIRKNYVYEDGEIVRRYDKETGI